MVDLHPGASGGRATRRVVHRPDTAGIACPLAQRVQHAALFALSSRGVRRPATLVDIELPPRSLRCCVRGSGSGCHGASAQKIWSLAGVEGGCSAGAYSGCARCACVAIVLLAITTAEVYSCAGSRGHQAADLPCSACTCCCKAPSLSPPSSSSASARPVVHVLLRHHIAMIAIRLCLLVAVLLGVALLTVTGQVSAEDPYELCDSNLTLCFQRRIRCRECWIHCSHLFKVSPPGLSAFSRLWAWKCGRYKH